MTFPICFKPTSANLLQYFIDSFADRHFWLKNPGIRCKTPEKYANYWQFPQANQAAKQSSIAFETSLLICRFIFGNCISRITCEFSVFNFRFSISAAAHSTQTLPICEHMNEELLHKNQWQWFIIYMKKKKPQTHTQMRKTPRRSRFQGTTEPFRFRLCTFCGKKKDDDDDDFQWREP